MTSDDPAELREQAKELSRRAGRAEREREREELRERLAEQRDVEARPSLSGPGDPSDRWGDVGLRDTMVVNQGSDSADESAPANSRTVADGGQQRSRPARPARSQPRARQRRQRPRQRRRTQRTSQPRSRAVTSRQVTLPVVGEVSEAQAIAIGLAVVVGLLALRDGSVSMSSSSGPDPADFDSWSEFSSAAMKAGKSLEWASRRWSG